MIIFINTQKKGTAANTFFEGILHKSEKNLHLIEEKNKNLISFLKIMKKINILLNQKDDRFTIVNDFGFFKNLFLLSLIKHKRNKINIYTTFYHHIFTFKECLIYFQFNELWKFFSLKSYSIFRKVLKINNIKFITVSDFTRNNMINNFSIDKNKIIVLWNQIMDKDIFTFNSKKTLVEKNSYILIISTLIKRKNIKLIENISKDYGKKIKFVCPSPQNMIIRNKLNYLKKNGVQIYHDLTDVSLKSIYLNSSCVLVPSIYEGLSLIPLETINISKPIIMSKIKPHLYWKLPERFYFDLNNYNKLIKKLIFYLEQNNTFVDYSNFKKFNRIFKSAQEERKKSLLLIYNKN